MAQMSEDQMNETQDTFALFDNKGDGKIAAGALGDALRALNLNPTVSEIKKCGYQEKPDGRISFEVFLPIFHTMARNEKRCSAEDLSEGFRLFDHDGSGTIPAAELRHILTHLGEKLTEEQVDQVLQPHETKNGCILYEEMIKQVMNS